MSKRSERITPSVANPTLPFKLPASWPYTAKIKYCRASGHKLQGCIQDMLRWQIPLLHGIAWVSSFCAGCRYHPSRIDFLHADSTRRCNMWRIYGNTVQQNKRQQKKWLNIQIYSNKRLEIKFDRKYTFKKSIHCVFLWYYRRLASRELSAGFCFCFCPVPWQRPLRAYGVSVSVSVSDSLSPSLCLCLSFCVYLSVPVSICPAINIIPYICTLQLEQCILKLNSPTT